MTPLELNNLNAKVEQSGNPASSTFETTKPSEHTGFTQKVEVEQGRGTPKINRKSPATTLFEEWFTRQIAQSDPKNKYSQDLIHHFKIWLRFLKEATPQEISKKTLEQYKSWLFEQRNKDGWYLQPSCIVSYLKGLLTLFERMRKEGVLPKNPLRPFYTSAVLADLKARHIERRTRWFKEREGRYTNEELLGEFLEHGKREYCKAYNQDIERVSRFLGEFAKRKNKTLFSLSESELNELRRSWFDIELHASLRVSDAVLMEWSYCLRLFYRWAFEEGHSSHFVLEHWNLPHIKAFLQAERADRDKEIKTKARHYNLKEILRAYWKYLKDTYVNYADWNPMMQNLRHFLRFLIGRGESVYTVTAESLEAYKQTLMSHEYHPGKYYTAYFQADRIRAVKRFFDWFTVKGYSVVHPLRDFGVDRYRKQIEPECQKRESQRTRPQEIPEPFQRIYQSITAHEDTLGLAKGTLHTHRRGWRAFFHYLEKISVERIEDVDEEVLNDYQVYLCGQKNGEGSPLSLHTRVRHLVAVKRLFNYLARFKFLSRDPSACIDLPKNPRGLPTSGMNDREVRQFLQLKEPKTWKERRDRAMLETLYSTGVRSNELRNLRVQDIDFVTGLVRVNVPKGGANYQRVIPIGRTALSWIQSYRQEVRTPCKPSEDTLFLTQYGKAISKEMILNIVKSHLFKSGIRKKVVTHSFRVSCATEMLKNKADIKFVQQQLGHSSISSTEKYLRLVPSDLKKVHSKTHPRERWNQEEAPCPKAV